ncbi:unnamed protein product [[Candida] boidinii]|uniref:Unnamed protein product n=1 Tax=Candida boidinii TaxID=5477 RepID=A0ACB5U9D2_CANBO|nr:unnamed protein product [[Candida] boidinii]GMF65613.1 unnamed protein product [[Candida] boidinii]
MFGSRQNQTQQHQQQQPHHLHQQHQAPDSNGNFKVEVITSDMVHNAEKSTVKKEKKSFGKLKKLFGRS